MFLSDADQLRETLAISLRELDEVRAALAGAEASLTAEREHSARLSRECQERHDELRAEVERLRAALKAWLDADDASGIVRDVAERQREACAVRLAAEIATSHDEDEACAMRDIIRATPLATEGDN